MLIQYGIIIWIKKYFEIKHIYYVYICVYIYIYTNKLIATMNTFRIFFFHSFTVYIYSIYNFSILFYFVLKLIILISIAFNIVFYMHFDFLLKNSIT